ncbi:MAG: hypothetical protein E6R04_10740 [Spirochaetes bacterium]|nr:MAG: hypothetical protein E6R04_10740 [Spirochaetota bacterium]
MTDFWHGGRRGIAVGEYIRSPDERRREWSARERQIEALARRTGYNSDRDPKRVYLTTDRELARGWVIRCLQGEGGGALYRVRPLPPSSVESDPDFEETGFSARRALVLEVAEDPVQMTEDQALRAVTARYSLWSDDSRMYDDDGYMLPPPEHQAAGATPELYRHLGRWFQVLPGYTMALRDGQVFMAPEWSVG